MTTVRLLGLLVVLVGTASGQRVGAPTDDLDKVPLDELFNIQVTSVGRKAQQLSKAPAAVFVLTAEEIRRSGATSIPEALQWVPGLTVLRLDGRSWVVSARGAARLYSDKILVMIDGRSLYTPLFSGVIWDSIDVPLEDVEQIEVVRGPGAVMWGANALNGVINIITKHTRSTKGMMVSAETGNELQGSLNARWGAAPSDRLSYRVWGKLESRAPAFSSPGEYLLMNRFKAEVPSIDDLDWASGRIGMRLDSQLSDKDQLTVEGDLSKTGRHDVQLFPVQAPLSFGLEVGHSDYDGGNVEARWTRTNSVGSESVLQFSLDLTDVDYPYIGGAVHNLTLDYQKRRQTGERNEIYWGGGYQQYWDDTHSIQHLAFNPASSIFRSVDLVLRDEWQLLPQRLLLSAGTRLDYNSYRHFEAQPSVRLLYTPNARQSVWFAASRAIRVPSRFDRNSYFDEGQIVKQGFPIHTTISGSESMQSESERSFEAGYRMQSGQLWSVDVSTFWSYYGDLRAVVSPALPQVTFDGRTPVFTLAMTQGNGGAGRSYGGEIWSIWQVTRSWRLSPSYSYLNESRWLPPAGSSVYYWDGQPETIPHQGQLRSQFDLSKSLQVDVMARVRSRDAVLGLPGVLLLDARLGWKPTRSGELSFAVKDLTGRSVLEGYSEGPTPSIPLRRTFVLKWTQRL